MAGAVVNASICGVLAYLAANDAFRRIIPNAIVLPATAIVLAAKAALDPAAWMWHVGAALAAGAIFVALFVLLRGGMGMGDAKLAVLIGAALGRQTALGLTLGLLAGGLGAAVILATRGPAARKTTMAFGPYLAAGAIAALLL